MSTVQDKIEIVKKHVRDYPDFPKPGVLFRDIFSVLQQPEIFAILCDVLKTVSKQMQPPVECVAALDARGFLFGPGLALDLKVPFVPIRKKGKLPGKCESQSYSLEYGQDTVEIQSGSIAKGQNVLIVDDLLATGGTLKAACELIEKVGGKVAGCLVVMELTDLKGREKVPTKIETLIQY